MSKKTFTAAPKPRQPTAEEIAAYESRGSGHDQQAGVGAVAAVSPKVSVPVPQSPNPVEPSKRLSLDLPLSVHMRFKTACSATGRKMVSELQDYIERRTAEMEAEAGISRAPNSTTEK